MCVFLVLQVPRALPQLVLCEVLLVDSALFMCLTLLCGSARVAIVAMASKKVRIGEV